MRNMSITGSEAKAQEALMYWAHISEKYYPELALLHHIPNGGRRDTKEAASLRRQGVKAGVPDLCLPVARCGYHGLYIELKVGKNRQTAAQKEWQTALNEQGYLSVVCYGWFDARDMIEQYLSGTLKEVE